MKNNNSETFEEINESKEINQKNNSEEENKFIQNEILMLSNSMYEEHFYNILIKSKLSFLNSIYSTMKEIIFLSYSSYNIENIITKIKLLIENRYNKDYKILSKSCKDIKNKKSEYEYLTNFIKHCSNTDSIAYHDCVKNKLNKYYIIKENNSIKYIFCPECKFCFLPKCIRMICIFCNKEYYSRVLKDNEEKNIFLANWNKYHCGSMKNHIMKCINCKNNLYIDLSRNILICKNKNCNFSSEPLSILWKCSNCGKDFRSDAKVYNLVELDIIKKAIKMALLLKKKAYPKELPCCKKNTENMEFYHNYKCKGILYSGFLFDKKIVVCSLCNAMNFKDKFKWICPLCNTKFHLHKFNPINLFESTKYIINREYSFVGNNYNKRKINKNDIKPKTDNFSNNININNYLERINYFYNSSTEKNSIKNDAYSLSRENKKKKIKRFDSISIDNSNSSRIKNKREKKYNTMMDILRKREIKKEKNKNVDDAHYISEFTFSNSFNYNDIINFSSVNKENNIKSIQINKGNYLIDCENNIKKENTMIYHKKLSNYIYFKQNKRNKRNKINKCISQINIFKNNPFEEKEKIKSTSIETKNIYKNKKINQKSIIINKINNSRNKYINKENKNDNLIENNIIPLLVIKKDKNRFSSIKIYKNKTIKKGFSNKINTKNNRRISTNLNKVNRNKIYSKTNFQVIPDKIFRISRNCIIPDFNIIIKKNNI